MKNSRLLVVVFLACLVTPMLMTPIVTYQPTTFDAPMEDQISNASSFAFDTIPLPQTPRVVRVAIYDEPNMTAPSYALDPGTINNNASSLAAMLNSHGVQTTLLDVHEIYNHELQTARYDVLVLVDNFPRENITNQVQEFWLGGGGLLIFDGSVDFLCYFGILPPDAPGASGSGVYWNYASLNITVNQRHPVTQDYVLGDTIETSAGYLLWDWPAISGSTVGSDCIRLATTDSGPNGCSVLGFDPRGRGGKIVTFAYDYNYEELPGLHPMIVDAVDWLCPRPKGRIIFDLSHLPQRSIDPWDGPYSPFPGSYTELRDEWVSHGFTVDKLYPAASGNNFTAARLDPYDMLVVVCPNYNYTSGDLTAAHNWANMGGSILAFGEFPLFSFLISDEQINALLNPFGLEVNLVVYSAVITTTSTFTMHPITEGCTDFYLNAYGFINVTGSATGVWYDGPNIVVGSSTYGAGRAVLITDMNWPQDGYLTNADNQQSALNMANWLSASTARVLLYTDEVYSINFYKTPVAQALNDLRVEFYLTGGFASPYFDYFNLSLYMYSWDLVIVDNANRFGLENYFDDIVNYLDTGSSLIFTAWNADIAPGHVLFNRLGVAHAASVNSEPIVHIWDPTHDVFAMPHLFSISNFNSTAGYADDGDRYNVYANATAIAGATPTSANNQAFIVVRNDGKTLLNGYVIDNFQLDEDDSTYPDRLELWINEIAFMLRPQCNLTLNVPAGVTTGQVLTFSVDVDNLGLSAALQGEITVVVPPGLGTLTDPATQPFNIPPGGTAAVTWHVDVTGLGNFTLDFTAIYHGLPGTTYSTAPASADVDALPASFLPPLPWWWWIVVLAVIIIVVVIIIILLLRRRKPSK